MRCVSPISVKDPREKRGSIRITVPCGKCGACKANRRAEWSFRLAEEFNQAKSAAFITLTYGDHSLPIINGNPSLRKRDFQLFMKKFRKKNYGKIRYYAVGEYGTKTHRPHYHIAMFNHADTYEEDILSSWTTSGKEPLGISHIGNITHASIHYITKYHVNYEKDKFEQFGIEPEFAVMSRRPGIGHTYVERLRKWHLQRKRMYVVNNGFKQSLPRYYKEKVFGTIDKQLAQLESITEADKAYFKEVNRLHKLGYANPEFEYERRKFEEALKLEKDAKRTSRL